MIRLVESYVFSAVSITQNQDSKLKLFLHLNKPWDDKMWACSKKVKILSFCGWPNCVEQLKIDNAIYWFNLVLISNYHLFNPSYKGGQHKVIEHSFKCIFLGASSACFAWRKVSADWLWHLMTFIPLVNRSHRCAAADAQLAQGQLDNQGLR